MILLIVLYVTKAADGQAQGRRHYHWIFLLYNDLWSWYVLVGKYE
jgi:hypothetical protein